MLTRRTLVVTCMTASMLFALPASAKTLIYFSEGSPEGFKSATLRFTDHGRRKFAPDLQPIGGVQTRVDSGCASPR